MPNISNFDDIIDSRHVIERIEELTAQAEDETLSADEAEELKALTALAEEGEQYAPGWRYGETLIRRTYFVTYAQELAEDIGSVSSDAPWPMNCIDWDEAARQLKPDYTSVDFDGVEYLIR